MKQLIAALLALAAVPALGAAAITEGPFPHVPRWLHTATLLPSGKVVLIGGVDLRTPQTPLAIRAIETWTPNGGFEVLSSTLINGHNRHTATLLTDGRIVVAGGQAVAGVGASSSIEIVDPERGIVSNGGQLLQPRSGHAAIPLPDGRILFAGGIGADYKPLQSAEVYDPASLSSRLVGPLLKRRDFPAGVRTDSGLIAILGGGEGNGSGSYPDGEFYDPTSERFHAEGTCFNEDRPDAVALPGGRIALLTSNQSVELYGPAGCLPRLVTTTTRRFGRVGVLVDGRLVIVGGTTEAATLAIEECDPEIGKCQQTIPLLHPRSTGFTITPLLDGRVFIVGGSDTSAPSELYYPSWRRRRSVRHR